jgi:hypothetical protein
MALIKDEPGSGSEAYETNFDDGIEEGSITDEDVGLKMEESDIKIEVSEIKVEESEDIKEEYPEATTISTIKPEPEVSQESFMLPRPFNNNIFINCNWVVTRWQYTFTHKQYTEQHK